MHWLSTASLHGSNTPTLPCAVLHPRSEDGSRHIFPSRTGVGLPQMSKNEDE